jgi:hypothetical protein
MTTNSDHTSLLFGNSRGVRGRRRFEARHDGRNRWLKRATVARDRRRQWFGPSSTIPWMV